MDNQEEDCKKRNWQGFSLGFVAVFFWSFNVIYAHYLSGALTPVQIAFFRWLIAALIFVPLGHKKIIANYNLLLENRVLIFKMALFGIALSNTFVYMAAHTATAIDMALIGTMGPIFLVCFSWLLLKISIKPKQIVGMLVSILGVLVIITNGHLWELDKFKLVIGDFWMLIMAISFGYYGTLQTQKPKNIPPMAMLPTTIVLAVIILLPFFIYSLFTNPIQNLSMGTISVVAYIGVFNSVIAYFCWNRALDKLGSLRTSIIYYIMPILSAIEAYFILGEDIHKGQIYGGLLVLVGIVLTNVHKKPLVPERA